LDLSWDYVLGNICADIEQIWKAAGSEVAIGGRNLYMRFSCSTGMSWGMNMVSKRVQNVLDYLQADFPDMDLITISGFPML